jgi:hypothetical protein
MLPRILVCGGTCHHAPMADIVLLTSILTEERREVESLSKAPLGLDFEARSDFFILWLALSEYMH